MERFEEEELNKIILQIQKQKISFKKKTNQTTISKTSQGDKHK